ncbi:MAG: ATP-binding protein [Pseudomonadota bacterium]
MIDPPIPTNETERLAAIERYRLSGLGREPEFDRIAKLAAALFGVQTALVSIVGAEEQCFRGSFGFDELATPRRIAFCSFAILTEDVMVVTDAVEDPRFVGNPLVIAEGGVRFYAGAPLIVAGQAVGTLCLIDPKARLFRNEDRALLEMLAATLVDIIELRVDHVALVDQTSLLRSTIESIDEGLAVFDADLRLMLWNSAFPEIFSYSPGMMSKGVRAGDLLRQMTRWEELGPGEHDEIVSAIVSSVRDNVTRRLEVCGTDRRSLEVWCSTMPDGRCILTVSDVTEQRRLARIKDEFVSTVSHELRTPLTSIVGSLGLLARGVGGDLPPKAGQLVGIALNNGERLTRLINDLLDIDKLDSGGVGFNFAPIELGELVEAAVQQNTPYAERFGVKLELGHALLPLRVSGDHDRLLQVLANLLSNAIKFSPTGGTVMLTMERRGSSARVSVTDRGPGIPEAFRAHLFRRFAQADSSDRRGQQGTGLGLAITQSIIERHGGRIGFESQEGQGTTFHIDLQLLDAGENRTPFQSPAIRVLLCTTHPESGVAGADTLRDAGFAVDLAGSAKEARARLASETYAALLLDLVLPDATGVGFVRALRDSTATRLLPVAVLSTVEGATKTAEWAALDLIDWLTQPVEGERLIATVQKMASGKRSGRARVLHVEDDRDVLRVVELALAAVADIDHAQNLAAARARLDAHSYDLVILDLALPDGSGLDLLSMLSTRVPAVPVVIFSASEPDAGITQQVSRALTKARTSIQQLADTVRELVGRNEETPVS